MLNVGNGSYVKIHEIEAIVPPESAPIKRMVSTSKDHEQCVDLTYGKRTKSVIVLKSGKLVLSSVLPDTLVNKLNK